MSLLLSNVELFQLLRGRYPNAFPQVLDASFNVPTERALDVFRDEFAEHMKLIAGDSWHEYYDCDNFAFQAMAFAGLKHLIARSAGKGTAQGVAFGVVCFRLDPANLGSGHAVNWRIRPDKSIVEFEPQTRRDLVLTKEQCASAWFVVCS